MPFLVHEYLSGTDSRVTGWRLKIVFTFFLIIMAISAHLSALFEIQCTCLRYQHQLKEPVESGIVYWYWILFGRDRIDKSDIG